MDVGGPSNFERIRAFFGDNHELISTFIKGFSISDPETLKRISTTHAQDDYLIDPHGAVGLEAAERFLEVDPDFTFVTLETAHPAKFIDVMENALSTPVEIPDRLSKCLSKEKKTVSLSNRFEDFRAFLLG